MKTEALKQALDAYGFDAAFGGARRDEEKSPRQGARVLLPHRRPRLGPQEPAARALAPLQRPHQHGRIASASSRCPTGPSSTSGSTSMPRTSPSCRSTSPPQRPVVERDGTLIVVDDERMPLRPARRPQTAHGALPHARLLPAHRRHRLHRAHPARDRRRDARRAHLRAPGPADRPRRERHRWRRRSGRAISDGRRAAGFRAVGGLPGARSEKKSLLRFLTCGSVDDGKSTLIGRLLYDTQLLFDDQLAALAARLGAARHRRRATSTSRCWSTAWRPSASRASPSTSPTASSPPTRRQLHRRRYARPRAVHPQHGDRRLQRRAGRDAGRRPPWRADADAAALLHRRTAWASGMWCWRSTRSTWSTSTRRVSRRSATTFSGPWRASASVRCSPSRSRRASATMSAAVSANTPWYGGPSLLDYLETVEVAEAAEGRPFRMPVQWVNRPDQDFRGYAGTVAAGRCASGDARRPLRPRGGPARVARIVTMDGDLDEAGAGRARSPWCWRTRSTSRAAMC